MYTDYCTVYVASSSRTGQHHMMHTQICMSIIDVTSIYHQGDKSERVLVISPSPRLRHLGEAECGSGCYYVQNKTPCAHLVCSAAGMTSLAHQGLDDGTLMRTSA